MADLYTIVTQVPTTEIGPTGTIVQAMQVTFTTKPHEVTGRVVIPMGIYTRAEVDKVVSAAATVIEDVQNL